jgi:aryl-alcohol dehydrogenase-like predicted oxidoreductase
MLTGNRNRSGELNTARSGSDPLSDEQYNTAADFDVVDRVAEVAAERQVPPARIALAWLLHKPAVTAPIMGATKLEHIEDALAAADLAVSDDEMNRLEEPYVPHRILGHS